MAKSKNGGTRAYIRGRIGSDVYSIGKNGKGEKQQVVRSLAETVANPRTAAQMAGRMFMSTVMQAVSALSPIIDHSFDGLPKGQPSISEFIRLNYGLVKADAQAHAASGNYFGLNKYQEKGAKIGAYVVSKGSAVMPSLVSLSEGAGSFVVALETDSEAITNIGKLRQFLGMGDDDYLTIVGINASGNAEYVRARINPELADNTVINTGTAVFVFEGNVVPTVTITAETITVAVTGIDVCRGLIFTKKTDSGYNHSNCVLSSAADQNFASDVALPTYPTGNEAYLNGGDI